MALLVKSCWAKFQLVKPELSGDFSRIMGWADKYRTLDIRTNADTLLMLRRHESLVLRVLDFVVLNICSLKVTALRLYAK